MLAEPQSGKLNEVYLQRWAGELGVLDLLESEFTEATAVD
jgi:hypothetical protein